MTAMATAGAQVRFVKCPKCLKVLPEPAAPMYKCGGCGAILRAKNRGSSKQNVSLAPESSSSTLLRSSTEAQVARAGSRISENCPREKGEPSASAICGTGEASGAVASDGKERVLGSTELPATTKSSEKGSSEAKTDYSFNRQEAESLQVREQDSDNSRQLHDAKASPESVRQRKSNDPEERLGNLRSPTVSSSDDGSQSYLHDELKASPAASQSVASEEEMLDGPHGAMQGNSLRSSTASSSDDGSHKHRQMSRKGSSEAKTEYFFNQEEEEEEKSLNVKASPESLSQSNGSEEGFDLATVSSSGQNYLHDQLKALPALSQSAASEEEMLDKPHGAVQSNNMRSSTASSSDDGSHKFRQMSRRTIRDPRFSGSVSTESGGGGENLSRNSSVNANAQRRGSLNSEAFFSVHSWVESEEEGPSRSRSRASASSESPPKSQNQSTKFKNLNLLKLVEELRDQLSEKKPRSRLGCSQDTYQWPQPCRSSQMPVSYSHCHLEPGLCCNDRLCTACSYDFCCHSSKPRRSVQQHQKARAAKSYCRPVSGGAPFVICSGCFEVLHMPADLLVSTTTSRSNKLKCGACSTVMVLSFPARAHQVAPQAPGEPPSEGPVSFSGEYGISFADGSSVEAEPVSDVSRASPRPGASSRTALHRLMGYSSARRMLL